MSIDPTSLNETLAKTVSALSPSLVRVHTWGGPATAIAWSETQLVTVHRAVARRDETPVTLPDGTRATARVIGRDPTTDLALLELDEPVLTPAPWAEPDVEAGHLVLIAGRPGASVKVTWGLISEKGGPWSTARGGRVDAWLDVDGALPDGFAGGPLVSVDGAIIGLNSRALSRGGSTLPTATVRRVVERLQSGTPLRQGYLGLGVHPVELPPVMAEAAGTDKGVLIVHLQPDGPAWKAGLLLGDVLLSVAGQPLTDPLALKAALGDDVVDTEVTLELLRGGVHTEVPVTVAERPQRPRGHNHPGRHGHPGHHGRHGRHGRHGGHRHHGRHPRRFKARWMRRGR